MMMMMMIIFIKMMMKMMPLDIVKTNIENTMHI